MIVHKSPIPDVEIPDVALTGYVFASAETAPDQTALMDGATGATFSYAEAVDHIRRLAGGLVARGLQPGETLAVMSPNVPEYAFVFHGAAVAGGCVTTVNPTYTADEIRFQLQDAGATRLVTIPTFVDTARAAMEGTAVTELAVIGAAEGVDSLSDWYGEPIDQVPVDAAEHVVALPYSSGTTGLPKGVMLTHRNLVANIAQFRSFAQMTEGEASLAVLPFFHIYGMQILMNGMLAQGVTVITLPRFDLQQVLQTIQDHRVSRFFAVPPIVLALAKQPIIDQYDLSSLTWMLSGAAPLGAELAAEAAARVGCEVVQGYGMTELSPVSHGPAGGRYIPGTVGITVANTECRLVDESGVDLDVGGEGELWIRGPQVMKGYLNNPEATAATIDADGWLHTGDVATIDADGNVTIVDRVKELIKYKGFQVPPAELEALLVTHPAVADVAVIGVPDVEAGELPKAFVVLKPGASVEAAELQEFVAGHVATYKRIRLVEFVTEIPKSPSGKILRRLLRQGTP